MKIAFVLIVLCCTLPIAMLVRRYDTLMRAFWIFFGAAAFFMSSIPLLDIGLINAPDNWVGFVYGLEVSVIDYLAFIAFLILPRHRTPFWFFLPCLVFTGIAAISVSQAMHPTIALFGVWQFAKMGFIIFVVARACAFKEIPYLLLGGMALGIFANFATALWQRIGLNYTQAPGLFLHQNTLGMIAHFVLYPYLIMLLTQSERTVWNLTAIFSVLGCILLTASRGAVGFTVVGIGLTFALVALTGITNRVMAAAAVACVATLAIAPAAYIVFEKRFERSALHEDIYDERAAFNRAADLILEDFPAGVGLNHYTHILKEYNYSQRAGIHQGEGNINNIVHDVYRLIGVETGHVGLIAFYALLLFPMVTAFIVGWGRRYTPDGRLLFGFGLAMLVAYLHSFFEWIFLIKQVQYVFAAVVGMTFGIASRTPRSNPEISLQTEQSPFLSGLSFKAGTLND